MSNLSEYALCFTVKDWMIVHSKDINSNDEINEKAKKAISDCHIYMINTRPQISFVRESIVYDKENRILSGRIKVNFPNELVKESIFSIRNFNLMEGEVDIKCLSPYREITIHDESDNVLRYVPAYSLLGEIEDKDLVNNLLNLKIEYIGQAYGSGNRNAMDRLKNHSKFQQILAELQYKRPDLEVFISMMSFQNSRLITSIDGRKRIKYNENIESKRLRNIIDQPLKKKEEINLIEAGLIRYFQPEFNNKLKGNFPSTKQQMLSKLSSLDVSGLIIEIPDSELGFRLYTDIMFPNYMHIAKYDLSTSDERSGFFNGSLHLCYPEELVRMKK